MALRVEDSMPRSNHPYRRRTNGGGYRGYPERARLRVAFWIVLAFILLCLLVPLTILAQVVPNTRLVVIPAYFADQAPTDCSPPAAIAAMMDEVASTWTRASYGKTVVSWSSPIMPPYRIPFPQARCLDRSWESGARQAAAEFGSTGDRTVYYQAFTNACKYGGEAAPYEYFLRINSTSPATTGHELGHSFGIGEHAYGFFPIILGDFQAKWLANYGDPDDIMAGGMQVSAIWRARFGWLTPTRHARAATFSGKLSDIEQFPSAATVQREDGITYWLEYRPPVAELRSSYWASTFIRSMLPGDSYLDAIGGVEISMDADGAYHGRTFAPPTPTPGPPTTPTPEPTFGTISPTPPTDCWTVPGYIRCSPTPTPAPPSTSTPSPTPTPALSTPTPTVAASTPPPSDATPGPCECGWTNSMPPECVPCPPPTPTATARVLPPTIPAGKGGCVGFSAFSIGAILGGYLFWWRPKKRGGN